MAPGVLPGTSVSNRRQTFVKSAGRWFCAGLATVSQLLILVGATSALGTSNVTLTWDPSPDTNVVGYFVYYGTVAGSYTNRVNQGNQTTANVPGLMEGVTYHFVVTAYTADAVESDPSNEVAFVVPGVVRLAAGLLPGDPMRINFPVAPGHTYVLQASEDLQFWHKVWATAGISNGWVEFVDTESPAVARRFYRLISY